MREFESCLGALRRRSKPEKNCHRQLQKGNHRETRDKSADVAVITSTQDTDNHGQQIDNNDSTRLVNLCKIII